MQRENAPKSLKISGAPSGAPEQHKIINYHLHIRIFLQIFGREAADVFLQIFFADGRPRSGRRFFVVVDFPKPLKKHCLSPVSRPLTMVPVGATFFFLYNVTS